MHSLHSLEIYGKSRDEIRSSRLHSVRESRKEVCLGLNTSHYAASRAFACSEGLVYCCITSNLIERA